MRTSTIYNIHIQIYPRFLKLKTINKIFWLGKQFWRHEQMGVLVYDEPRYSVQAMMVQLSPHQAWYILLNSVDSTSTEINSTMHDSQTMQTLQSTAFYLNKKLRVISWVLRFCYKGNGKQSKTYNEFYLHCWPATSFITRNKMWAI